MSADELNTESINFEKDQSYESVNIVVAHPDSIVNWSSGEIKNPETINYRTFKPEPGGLSANVFLVRFEIMSVPVVSTSASSTRGKFAIAVALR